MKDKTKEIFQKLFKVMIMIFNIFKIILKKFYRICTSIIKLFSRSIRIELIVTFIVCIAISILVFFLGFKIVGHFSKREVINYGKGIRDIDYKAECLVNNLSYSKWSIKDTELINQLIYNATNEYDYNSYTYKADLKAMITDLYGNVIYKSENAEETKVDIQVVVRKAMENRSRYGYIKEQELIYAYQQPGEYICFYPINFKDDMAYLIYKGVPIGETKIIGYKGEYHIIIPVILSVILFFFLFYILTNRKMTYIEEISEGLLYISKGNLDFKVSKRGKDELSSLAENINYMSETLQNKIVEEKRAENTKNELITNVSHDLRTPLTSVIGYLGLLKDKKYENDNQLDEYVNIAFNKSEKLKNLIEDLFEYTKVANRGIKLNYQDVAIDELITQLIEEYVPIFEENNLVIEKSIIDEKVTVKLDPDKTVRVFENLLINAVKYSFKSGKIKVSLFKDDGNVVVAISNKGKNIPNEELEKLFDRFYKIDKSRNSDRSGSGLGLAIAKNIVEMQGGSIWAECLNDNIRFFVSFKL